VKRTPPCVNVDAEPIDPLAPLGSWGGHVGRSYAEFGREMPGRPSAQPRTHGQATGLDLVDMKRLGVRWERPAASAEERRRLDREEREIKRAGVVGLVVDPAGVAGGVLDVVHHVVGARCNARKTTPQSCSAWESSHSYARWMMTPVAPAGMPKSRSGTRSRGRARG
jgi:hypothetical protein